MEIHASLSPLCGTLAAPGVGLDLRCVVVGEQSVERGDHAALRAVCADASGSSTTTGYEATIDSTYLGRGAGGPSTVCAHRSPVRRHHVAVLDAELAPAAEASSTWAGAARRGYLGAPATTAEAVVPAPAGAPRARGVRTGDLVRRLPGGDLLHLGRHRRPVSKVQRVRMRTGDVRRPEPARSCRRRVVAVQPGGTG
jgi:non-ribosomal peptide synthetase component F